jgi:3-phosphoshikimate 1-carboxyvinyltransferase
MTDAAAVPVRLSGPVRNLDGAMTVPTSKSITNRALIMAAVADGGVIRRALDCEDTRLLAQALEGAGWGVEWSGDGTVRVGPRRAVRGRPRLDLGNSGTGSRLLLALLAATPGTTVLDGTDRLRQRPMGPLVDALRQLGAAIEPEDRQALPLTINGRRLAGGAVRIRPEVSSQFVSALALVGPLFRDGLDLRVDGPLPSSPYLELTCDALAAFGAGVDVAPDRRRWRIEAGGVAPTGVAVEGDWSAAAFPMCAAGVAGGTVAVAPLAGDSRQGDRVILEILARGGVQFDHRGDEIVARGPMMSLIEADLTDCPDAFPALVAAAAARAPGSLFTGLGALVHKESDRLGVMVDNLSRLGARFERSGTQVRVLGPVQRDGAVRSVRSADDHRIAMAMAVASLAAGPLDLDDGACVRKSFPAFWDAWSALTGHEVQRR